MKISGAMGADFGLSFTKVGFKAVKLLLDVQLDLPAEFGCLRTMFPLSLGIMSLSASLEILRAELLSAAPHPYSTVYYQQSEAQT